MTDLIARLEAAAEGSRELDVEIQRHRTGHPDDHWYELNGKWARNECPPRYTTSLDAALTLVPEGWFVRKLAEYEDGWTCTLIKGARNENGASAATPALALCIAALRARQGME